ncbi:hypothetical protein BDC45DRAFT_533514 [Circinella umbellata]|nr:hypothetical protein BDC45DRAFT_533514 [Circinella umbellata]
MIDALSADLIFIMHKVVPAPRGFFQIAITADWFSLTGGIIHLMHKKKTKITTDVKETSWLLSTHFVNILLRHVAFSFLKCAKICVHKRCGCENCKSEIIVIHCYRKTSRGELDVESLQSNTMATFYQVQSRSNYDKEV